MSQINESTIKTPGVYVTEIPSFPPSIAQVATAVPAFIGYTQTAKQNGKDVTNKAVRISSLVQYAQYFGGDYENLQANVVLKGDNSVDDVSISPKYQLYNAVRMFYINGGVNCYIISIGGYKADGTAAVADFTAKAFEVLRKEDEPTLIVVPDAVMLGVNDFNSIMQSALKQCHDLQDRFTILDVLNGDKERTFDSADVITVFRNGIGTSNLNYGAAYYPWLRTSLPYSFSYQNIQLQKPAGSNVDKKDVIVNNSFVTQLDKAIADLATINNFIKTPGFAAPFNAPPLDGAITDAYAAIANTDDQPELQNFRIAYIKNLINGFIGLNAGLTDTAPGTGLTTKELHDKAIEASATSTFSPIERLMRELILLDVSYPDAALGAVSAADFGGYANAGTPLVTADPAVYNNLPAAPPAANDEAAVKFIRPRFKTLYDDVVNMILSFRNDVTRRIANLEVQLTSSNAVYAAIVNAVKNEGIVVPPSGAIAGVYATVDGTRGVWKAPANVSLSSVIEPVVNIDDNIQDDLNIDVDSGKSINAIRAFTGKGILVWGARTLDGNSNDFRYISVRRFYIMVEESTKKAAMQFVFEPNDANTWVRVRAMIENFLTNLWRLGALAGSKPEQAFYVKVGLGQTMTFDDILNGKMIVEIGMAPVRPAEFIILRFSQIQQQA